MPIHAEVSGKQGTSLSFIARGHVVTMTLAGVWIQSGLPLPSVPLLCLVPSSRDFAVVSGAASGGALGEVGALCFSEAGPLVARAGGKGAGAAMQHPGVQAGGHREGLEVAPEGRGQRQPVHQVHRRAGHHRPAAQVLQTQYLGEKRKPGPFVLSWAWGQHRGSRTPVHPSLWGSGARCQVPVSHPVPTCGD